MSRYIQEWSEDGKHVKVIDRKTGYSLSLCYVHDGPFDFAHTSFHSKPDINRGLWITARDFQEYDPDIRNHMVYPAYQYIDVGAGLGEFIPRLVKTFESKLENLPLIIDPANYDAMQGLLDFSLTLDTGIRMKEKLSRLNERCRLITDPRIIRLINLTLEEALKQHNEILGIADIVIDNAGASQYTDFKYAWQLEKKLLKPTGFLYSEVVKSGGVYRSN